ncbi:MAG: HlyD family efflux transporter periplasmic adaptor subunit [Chloroflexota bacterium]
MKTPIRQLTGIILTLGVLTACSLPSPSAQPEPAGDAEAIPTSTPPNSIIADAIVVPQRHVDISFTMNGTVDAIFVEEGDVVEADEPLVQLDTQQLELEIAQSKASLAQAQASYDKIEAGATPEEIAAQQAIVRNAEANLQRTRAGNYTSADVASASAQLQQAEAALAALLNPTANELSIAEERIRQAEVEVQSTRDSTSQVKTSSELALQQAADALVQAQASYASAKSDWEFIQDTGQNPSNPETINPQGQSEDNDVNNSQREQYYAAFVQAEAALRSAEKNVTDKQVTLEQARNNEITSIQTAESRLADARAQLEALKTPGPNEIAQQQAVVDQARANLQRVQQGGTQAEVSAAQASVEQQLANLDQLTVPARVVDLAEAQARIEAQQVVLQQAEQNLEEATLRAPFAGTIAEQNLEIGQQISVGSTGGATPFVLADFGTWQIETDNLSERDVVRFGIDSPAQITFDALPDVILEGTVTSIQPRGVDRFGDITYTVIVTPDAWDERLRWNMSASVEIEVEES